MWPLCSATAAGRGDGFTADELGSSQTGASHSLRVRHDRRHAAAPRSDAARAAADPAAADSTQ